jgi:hypothetical protein
MMLDAYLAGSVGQLLERARHLQGVISKQFPAEFRTLAQTCRNRVNLLIAELQALLTDPRLKKKALQGLRLRAYKRLVDELDFVECVGFAALDRINRDDIKMTQLVGEIAEEMMYPLLPPVVSCQSQAYFHAFPDLNLLRVPLKEARFLLHLPDLYHELAHFILTEENNPVVEPYQKALTAAASVASGHLAALLSKPSRGPKATQQHLLAWTTCWMGAWAAELFCDLFSALAMGPAFGWSHLHLCAKRGGDPFLVETSPDSTHPPNEARMFVVLEALSQLGYKREADAMQRDWRALCAWSGYKSNANYQMCFPQKVLARFAAEAIRGYEAMNCRSSAPAYTGRIHNLLNEAWKQFWKSPDAYPEWEKQKQAELFPTR